MGRSLLDGWLESGWSPGDADVVIRDPRRAEAIRAELEVNPISIEDAAQADLVVVAVKPHQFETLLAGFAPKPGAVVISVAAGVTVAQLESMLPEGSSVARVMPNTGAVIRESMTGVVAGRHLDETQLAAVTELFDRVGKTMVLPESQLDAMLAVAGSGPAYVYYFAEAMIEGAVHQGLSRSQAAELVAQTFLGSSKRLATSDEGASKLREGVTSPAGTTAAAMRKLDDHAVRAGILDAIEACRARALEMGG